MKPRATEQFLERALEEFLAGKPVTNAQTVARGCLINFEADDHGDAKGFIREGSCAHSRAQVRRLPSPR